MKRLIDVLIDLFLLCVVFTVGWMLSKHHHENNTPREVKKPCYGYTVVDNSQVVDCKGDTITYQWQHKYKRK